MFFVTFTAFYLTLCLSTFAAPVNETTLGFEQMRTLSLDASKIQSISVTRNDLDLCRPVTVIFARGTIESGNVGSLAGPPFFNALDLTLGGDNVGVQGVDYPATILGYLAGGDSSGADKLASLTEEAATKCPSTQIVLSGYSQGAQVVHNGAAELSEEVAARIAAVVLFGDPFDGRPFPNIDAGKAKTFCFAADLICKFTAVVDAYHLAYAVDAFPAALFVASKVKI